MTRIHQGNTRELDGVSMTFSNKLVIDHGQVSTNGTLTDYEQLGFGSDSNLADGHAYQDLTIEQSAIVGRLPTIWSEAQAISIPESEAIFRNTFAQLIGSEHLTSAPLHLMLPTASNSIDLVAALLHAKGMRVLLVEPTFDNLALILRRRGVPLTAIPEEDLHGLEDISAHLADADALFVVNPNNPTGGRLTESRFLDLLAACKSTQTTVVIDASFRLFYKQEWDTYRLLLESGASFICFEDTGKVFPTQDMKASLLVASEDHAFELRAIYNEIYLCVSKFTLLALTSFLNDARSGGLKALHNLVAHRRDSLRSAIGIDRIDTSARDSQISVEWISLGGLNMTDLTAESRLREMGLSTLPGRGFFWNGAHGVVRPNDQNLRVSLLKSHEEFQRGVSRLAAFVATAVTS